MLLEAIGGFLPAGIAVAISPIPVIAIVVVLGTPSARSNGPLFALGWIVGLAVVSTLVVLVIGSAGDDDAANTAYWLKIAVGALLLVMGAMQWKKRPKDGEYGEMPGWMATIDRVTPGRAFGIGAALSGANPKNFALTAAAAASIAEVGLTGGEELIAIAVFVVLGSIVVVGAVVFYLVDADRAAGPLASVRAFMTQHDAVIMMVILVLLGASLLGDGVSGLQA